MSTRPVWRFGDLLRWSPNGEIVMFLNNASAGLWRGAVIRPSDPEIRSAGTVVRDFISSEAWEHLGNCRPDGFGTFEDDL